MSPTATPAPASATSAAAAVANPTLGPLPDGVAPARPAALDQPPTLEGAKAIATYFLLLFSYVYQSNDLTAWTSLSHAQCAFCTDVRSDIEKHVARGAHVTGGTVIVSDVKGTEVDVGHFFNIQATIRESGSKTVEATGALTDDLAPGSTATDMVVLYESGAWSVRSVDHKPIDGK